MLAASAVQQAGPAGAAAEWEDGDGDGDGQLCVVCVDAPKQYGCLHAGTVHLCLCRDCSELFAAGKPCPMCREPIVAVVKVF